MPKRENLRNIAIVAHVDHGKTTLVDALFRQGGVFRDNQQVEDRVMDSNDQERERGITILAKATSVQFGDMRLQLVDTPGHADFGGEVERTLRMVDGVLLLVDAAEGPLPQTRFVLRKAFELKLPALVAINKIDRDDARPLEVLDEIYELFLELGADDIDFPVLYTNARQGTASRDLEVPGVDLRPLVDAIAERLPAPDDLSAEPFSMQVNQLGYDPYVGRLVIGRVLSGVVKNGEMTLVQGEKTKAKRYRVTGVFTFQGVKRIPLEEARSGDLVAISGVEDVNIGDTLCDPTNPTMLPPIQVEEPTVAMVFQVNNGPLAGRSGGDFVTSRQIRDRLMREAYANVSIRIEDGETPEQFRVLARGELQLAVLIENMRREKYEFCVRNPQVLTRDGVNGKEEPTERLVIDVPVEHLGAVTQLLGTRKAQLAQQKQEGMRVRVEYLIPTRGLFGLRSYMLTQTRGTAIMHSVFECWTPWAGPIARRANGAMVADRADEATAYALFKLQPRGQIFIPAGSQVYEGMIIGEHSRANDLNVNVVREKKLTNIRAAGKDEAIALTPPPRMSLEDYLEWIRDDEMVEVTPKEIRLRKVILEANRRPVLAESA
ncbi:MAG: translational GTPase TypA [Myxococcales bacterium]|nr:translational GTPase TypA [Myxococcales bacterium]